MPIFRCEKCGCMENTACCRYWIRKKTEPALCSACDPRFGQWHGLFPKQSAAGMLVGSDGFLYYPEENAQGQLDTMRKHQGFKIVGKVGPNGNIESEPQQPENKA